MIHSTHREEFYYIDRATTINKKNNTSSTFHKIQRILITVKVRRPNGTISINENSSSSIILLL
jgi:hypothetical protein